MAFPEGFEWEEAKAKTNLSKHGLSFKDIVRLFDQPFFEDYDPGHSDFEDRYCVLGLLDAGVCCVALVYRGERRRLISARPATPTETRTFYSRLFCNPII